MRPKVSLALAVTLGLLTVGKVAAQNESTSFRMASDPGAEVRKLTDGVYVYIGRPRPEGPASNAGIIITQDGVVLLDSGDTPIVGRAIQGAVKKLTSLPVRYLIHQETHGDHRGGDFIFSPPAVIIAHEGTAAAWKDSEPGEAGRIEKLRASSPEMRAALEGYHSTMPGIEYRYKMTLNEGGTEFDLLYLKNVHSEADTAVWLPKERVLFSASAAVVNQFMVLRPWNDIPDVLAAIKMLKGLNPEFVISDHGTPGTIKIFDDQEQFYALLLDRVGKLVKEGKSLEEIQKEVKMPEYDQWQSANRLPGNIEQAYNMVVSRLVFKGDN